MDGADLVGILGIGLIVGTGLASFALAGLVGGAMASMVRRRGIPSLPTWLLVTAAGTATGLTTLVGSIVLWDSLEPVLDNVPLLYPAWAMSALAGAVSQVAVWSRSAPTA